MTAANGRTVVADGLVLPSAVGETLRLRGSRCRACGECFFPSRDICTNCSQFDQEPREFGPSGTLYTYTILMDPPSAPPRAVGQVEFGGKLRVQGLILTESFASLSLDMPMYLSTRPLGTDDQGIERVGFGFRPAA